MKDEGPSKQSSNPIDRLPHTREEYGEVVLSEEHMHADPMQQFSEWFIAYAELNLGTANAMVLSTVDADHYPDSRVVLLKELDKDQFIFYTQYTSVKGLQMELNPFVALNFHWPQQARQVRVRGKVQRITAVESDVYFASRPRESQLGAVASSQSKEISGRQELEQAYLSYEKLFAGKSISRPESWGGYAVTPHQIEFWQGRNNRLHDRIQYSREGDIWRRCRLAP